MSLDVDLRSAFEAEGADRFEVDVALSVQRGETVVVLGPSGSGKTLLLETIAGLHDYEGSVALDGEALDDRPPDGRGFGFVFQDYALFPHMTARENVAFGQRYREGGRDPTELLDALGVAALVDRRPPTLSGGERQRVALARALAVAPEVLLLDEPLSSLDVPTRRALRDDLLDVLAGATAVYVTHDRTTARALADRIAVVRDGEVVQTGTPESVFERPATPFVARFTGANCVPLEGASDPLSAGLDVPAGATHLAVRPEHVRLETGDLEGRVVRVTREDGIHRVRLDVDGRELDAFATSPPVGDGPVGVALPPEHVTFPTAEPASRDGRRRGGPAPDRETL